MDPKIKREKRIKRHKKVRAKIKGTAKIPRLCVFRSTKHIYAQLIDDEKGKTLATASDLEIKTTKPRTRTSSVRGRQKTNKEELKGKVKISYQVGKLIAEKALQKKIQKIVFDRGGYTYQGRVKSLAEGAREGGLKF